jgi:hypothetical protein
MDLLERARSKTGPVVFVLQNRPKIMSLPAVSLKELLKLSLGSRPVPWAW